MKKFRCRLCGYIYEGDELPLNYNCPICGVDVSHFEEYEEVTVDNRVRVDEDNPGIYRIEEKCINCGMCKKICTNDVGILYDEDLEKSVCLSCGQCVLGCPLGALVPKYNYKEVSEIIKSGVKTVVAFTAPAVRVSLGEEFGLPFGSFVEGKMVSALKALGFNYVFDTTFGADMTIVEEVSELVSRIKNNGVLPMFTSCCPSWVRYAEVYHPEILPHLSSVKSPIGIESALIKNYFSEVKGINKEDIVTVAIAPCTAKKMEARREELTDTDYVLTTSELAIYMREENIKFNELGDSQFDLVMGKGSGGGIIFGNSGGVMASALRTLKYMISHENYGNDELVFNELRTDEGIREASVKIGEYTFNVAVIYGMRNVEEFISRMKDKTYHFVEVMNCPDGCVGGGGQALKAVSKLKEAREERKRGLYNDEECNSLKFSHDNKEVIDVYANYLGKPLSKKAREVLHTTYSDKSSILKEKVKIS